jgi:hypothetical protein
MLSRRTRPHSLLRRQGLSAPQPRAGVTRPNLSRRAPIPPTASLCPCPRECSRTATSAAPRAYDTCPHVSLPPHDPYLPARLPPCSPAHALHILRRVRTTRRPFSTVRTQRLPFAGSPPRAGDVSARSRARLLEHDAAVFGLRLAVPEQAYMRAATADMLRDATTATSITLATRHDAQRRGEVSDPFPDGARTHTRRLLLEGGRTKRRGTAPRREGRARLTSIPASTSPRYPSALRPRAGPALAHGPRDDALLSRRRQRRPQSTASLSGSAVLRELVNLDLHGSLLHRPAPRRALRLVGPYLAPAFPADAPVAVHGLLSPEARRGSGWTW